MATTGDTNIASLYAVVQDFGCRQEITIYKYGETVMKVGFAEGRTFKM